ISYIFICIIGALGNLLVMLATRKRRMRNVTNQFIANLALADFTVCVITIPISLVYTNLGHWPFRSWLCKTMPYLQGITVSASVGTLVAIASDRFIVIVFPTKRKFRISRTWITVVAIWLLSAAVAFPVHLYSEVTREMGDGLNVTSCIEVWPSQDGRKTYALLLFLVLFLLPMTAISLMYAAIIYKLRTLHPTQEVTMRTHKKLVRMLVVVIVTFAVCWIPYHVTFLYLDKSDYITTEAMNAMVLFSQWLMYTNSCLNPIIYILYNANYRREF
ncbi:predicted protein, partial [Nematostella vectensis]